jgi:GGDEF domain-containing protein
MRDTAGRFVILCPETDSDNCGVLADRIRGAVSGEMGDRVSWGIASFPQETLEFEELLHKAIQRLNQKSEPIKAVAEERVERPSG